jgi:uncharacterized protein with von Willebrand factor type A (vWA) domain
MSPEEIKEMLGIKPEQVKEEASCFDDMDNLHWRPSPELPETTTCLNVDKWEFEQGKRILGGIKEDCPAAYVMADLFAACFRQYPEIVGKGDSERFHEFLTTLMESPEYIALHHSTQANMLASEMAAIQFYKEFEKLAEQDERDLVKFQGEKERTPNEKHIACIAAVGKAVKKAQEESGNFEDYIKGCGIEEGSGGDIDTQKIKEDFQRIKNNAQLRAIMARAGRYRMCAQSKQRQKVTHGYDDMVGVKLDGDIGRLLPVELSRLSDPDFELDAMRRLVEKQSMCRDYRGVEKVGKGPIIVCVDESGSTRGDLVAEEKAFALSLLWVANHQKRWCCLVGFANGPAHTILTMKPGTSDHRIVDWLEHFFNGGTTLDVPLQVIPSRWEEIGAPSGKTDMILLTDAQVRISSQMVQNFNKWKLHSQARVISIVFGNDTMQLPEVSDECFTVSGLSVNSEAVSKCLSI